MENPEKYYQHGGKSIYDEVNEYLSKMAGYFNSIKTIIQQSLDNQSEDVREVNEWILRDIDNIIKNITQHKKNISDKMEEERNKRLNKLGERFNEIKG